MKFKLDYLICLPISTKVILSTFPAKKGPPFNCTLSLPATFSGCRCMSFFRVWSGICEILMFCMIVVMIHDVLSNKLCFLVESCTLKSIKSNRSEQVKRIK